MRKGGGSATSAEGTKTIRLTSERVLRSVKGIKMNPTPVRAVLPTSKSPAVVSFTLPPAFVGNGAPLARN